MNGLPVLDKHLRWPGCELFLMGPWVALQDGATSVGIHTGGWMAYNRIVPALTKASIARTVSPKVPCQVNLISDAGSLVVLKSSE